jgi:predicted NBD/HSP70 family sugar kinase
VRAIVADLGGTFLRCGVATESGQVIAIEKMRVLNFLGGYDPATIWDTLVTAIEGYAQRSLDIAGDGPVVIAFPGPVAAHSTVLAAPTVVGADAHIPDLCKAVSDRTFRPVYLLNDLSAAAWHISETIPENRFMVVTVSSGIGSKIFDRSTAIGVLDEPTYSGEIGHVRVDQSANAVACDCGGIGHLGAIASGRGIERLAKRVALADQAAFANSACATLFGARADTLTNEDHIIPSAQAGDQWALDVIRTAIQPLAQTLVTVVAAAGLEKIVIIGGFAVHLGQRYIELLSSAMAAQCPDGPLFPPLGKMAGLADRAELSCLLGAATFAKRELKVLG